MAKLGIQMIDMYVSLINEEFQPLISQIKTVENAQKAELEIKVKKDLGIYNLWMEQKELELKLEQVKEKMIAWTSESYCREAGKRRSRFSDAVDIEMAKMSNGIGAEIKKAKADTIKKIKLSGVSGDTADVFSDLPKILDKLTKKLAKALPAPIKPGQLV